jgi:hypothetical protein
MRRRRGRPLSSLSHGTFFAVARLSARTRVRSASPVSPNKREPGHDDEILLQFEAIRLIAASLIALAITVAWLLAIGR